MRFKNLSIAAVKALKAYGTDGTKREKWSKEMSGATERYAEQTRTDREGGEELAQGRLRSHRQACRRSARRGGAHPQEGARENYARRALAARALVRRALLLEARASGRPRGRSGSEEGTKLH